MDNYVKGKNVDPEEVLDNDIISHLPVSIFPSQPSDVNSPLMDRLTSNMCWMHMRGGSKLRNFIGPCVNSLNSSGFVIISGSGSAVIKASIQSPTGQFPEVTISTLLKKLATQMAIFSGF